MDVDQRLSSIDRKQDHTCHLLETLTEKFEERIATTTAWRQRVEGTVWGLNGDADHSLVVRLDRLEQTNKQQAWVMKIISGVAITAVLGGILSLIMA